MFGVGGVCRVGCRFGLVGAFVGKFPCISILLSLMIGALAIPPFFFRLNVDFTLSDGFIPADAPSRREVAVQRRFFGKQNEQWYMALFGVARAANGSLLNDAEYEEFDGFYRKVSAELNYTVDGHNFTYSNICRPLCDINSQMRQLMQTSWMATLRYPVSQVFSYDINIGKHVFRRFHDSRTGDLTGAGLLAYYFTVFLDDDHRRRQVEEFEIVVRRLAAEHNDRNGTKVEILVHGSHGVISEIQRGVMDWFKSLAYGVGAATVAALAVSWLLGRYSDDQYTWRRVALAAASLTLAIGALVAALGYALLAGAVVNLLFVTSPIFTFIFLINFHNGFTISDAWSRFSGEAHRKQFTASERLAAAFEQIAPSYLLSNSMLFVGFLAVNFLTLTNYGSYALYLAFAVLVNFIFQTLCYSALLVLLCFPGEHQSESIGGATLIYAPAPSLALDDGNGEKLPAPRLPPIIKPTRPANGSESEALPQSKKSRGKPKKTEFQTPPLSPEERRRRQIRRRRQFRVALAHKIFQPLSTYLSSRVVQTAVGVAFALLLCYTMRMATRLNDRMDYKNILPPDSPANRAFDIMDNVWSDMLQIVYFIEKAPNFENADQYAEFRNFVSEATSLPQAMAPRAHMSWVFDYFRHRLNLDYFGERNVINKVNMTGFKDFISTFPYEAWQGGVHFVFRNSSNPQESPTIERMVMLVAYNGTVGLNGKQKLMRNCRRVAARYPQFRIVAFDTDSETVDVMDSVMDTVIRVLICLIAVTALLGVFILSHALASLLTVIDAAAILVVFYGLAHALTDLELDFLSTPGTWTVAGQVLFLSVQYTAHYLQCWAKEDQQRRALEHTTSALWKTTLLWLLVAVPQVVVALAPMFAVQARLQLIGALIAPAFALLIQPAQIGFVDKCLGAKVFQ